MSEASEEIKVLLPRHRALLRLIVLGRTLSDAAEELGYSVSRASVIVNSPVFIAEQEKMEKELDEKTVESTAEVREDIKRAAVEAARVLREELKSDSGPVRVSAAKDILDRAGVQKEEKLRVNAFVEPSEAFIAMLARAFKEGKLEPTKTGEDKDAATK